MDTATAPAMSDTELELVGPDWAEFVAEMEADAPDGGDASQDENRINWILGKMSDITRLVLANKATALCGTRHWEEWLAGENMALSRQTRHWHGEIACLMPSSPEDAKKTYGKLSRSLPNGDVGWKKDKDTIDVSDPKAALAYAETNHLEVAEKTTFSVSAATLKTHMEATGALEGDGWRHVEGKSHVFVKPAK